MAKGPQSQTHQRPMGNFIPYQRQKKKTNSSSALLESMAQKIGALSQRIYQAGLASNAGKDGTTILTLILKRTGGRKKKIWQ
jgi:hypothetical protein